MAKFTAIKDASTSDVEYFSIDTSDFESADQLALTKSEISFYSSEPGFYDEFISWTITGDFTIEKNASDAVTALSGTVTAIEFDYEEYNYEEAETVSSYAWSLSDCLISVRDLQTPTRDNLLATVFRGDDAMKGSAGDDALSGFAGRDTLLGARGADTLDGGDDDDILVGGADADKLLGGKGADTASYETAAKGVAAYLGKPELNTGDAKGDAYASIENLKGSKFADTLYGGPGANALSGGAGSDRIGGRGGNDLVETGSGWDSIVFNTALDAKRNIDTVSDFSHRRDIFELDAGVFKGLEDGRLDKAAFKLIAGAASSKGVDKDDRILFDKAHGDLYYDRDGSDATYERVKFAEVADKSPVDHTDFLIV